MTGSWSGGFQGQVTVTAGSSGLSSWAVGWAFPSGGNQVINDMWNATYTQSGQNVTAHNEPYNGSLAAGASTTFGFTATASADTGPATLTCT
jgi:cellulase/cellobiase CelA1